MSLLREHPSTDGSLHNTETAAACGWLRETTSLWQPWVEAAQAEAVRIEAARVATAAQTIDVPIALLFPGVEYEQALSPQRDSQSAREL
eukprot:COSAG06_NODE_61330_length_268_cov_0.603550_1_plen_88_part_11